MTDPDHALGEFLGNIENLKLFRDDLCDAANALENAEMDYECTEEVDLAAQHVEALDELLKELSKFYKQFVKLGALYNDTELPKFERNPVMGYEMFAGLVSNTKIALVAKYNVDVISRDYIRFQHTLRAVAAHNEKAESEFLTHQNFE